MLRQRIQDDMKAALKAADKRRLGAIRLVFAAIRQREVDERIEELDDLKVLEVIDKQVKQRYASAKQYAEAGRQELADQETYEIGVCQEYLPAALTTEEVAALIDQAIANLGATSMQDMGKVMGWIKSQAQGRVDMGAVSKGVKERLAG